MKKTVISIIFILLIFCFFSLWAKTKSLICKEGNDWINEIWHQKKGDIHYFIGIATEQETPENAKKKALVDAFSNVSDSVGIIFQELFENYKVGKKYLSKEDKGRNGLMNSPFYEKILDNDSLVESGIRIYGFEFDIKNYEIEKVCGLETDMQRYNAAVKISVPEEEIERINVEIKGEVAWNFKTSHCSKEQSEKLEQIFTDTATKLGLNLKYSKESRKMNFSKKMPKTKFFAEVEAICNKNMNIYFKHYNLIEQTVKTCSSEGNNFSELAKELLDNCEKLEENGRNKQLKLWKYGE